MNPEVLVILIDILIVDAAIVAVTLILTWIIHRLMKGWKNHEKRKRYRQ